jgi:2'-5' RNA ligase
MKVIVRKGLSSVLLTQLVALLPCSEAWNLSDKSARRTSIRSRTNTPYAATMGGADSTTNSTVDSTKSRPTIYGEMDGDCLKRSKFHHLTVCMVPPESSEWAWEMITRCRTELRDPGLFRWPPHVNLLYPFLDIRPATSSRTSNSPCAKNADDYAHAGQSSDLDLPPPQTVDPEILEGLVSACSQCEPFIVHLRQFGTFGNRNRGVLWLYPESSYEAAPETKSVVNDASDDTGQPLMRLQALLLKSFPTCTDQTVKSSDGTFHPHMTVSHFASHEAALAAQKQKEAWWPRTETQSVSFPVHHIYLLQRSGYTTGW